MAEDPVYDDAVERVSGYLADLIGFFTGSSMEPERFNAMRSDLLRNPYYNGLAPQFLRRCRDTASMWSFAKTVDPTWEKRRQFLREQFEPLLQHLEGQAAVTSFPMQGPYDSNAWTGVKGGAERVKAVKTLLPVAQAAVEALIHQLEQPTHNGGPRLDEVENALRHLRGLHRVLGEILDSVERGELNTAHGEGLIVEAARFGRRAAKCLKHDPLPYALSATVMGLMTACGFDGLGGYLSAMVMFIKKPEPPDRL